MKVTDDFNIDFKNKKTFLSLKSLIISAKIFSSLLCLAESHTCFAKTHKYSIDLVLTNQKYPFQLIQATEIGISDVRLLLSTFVNTETVRLKHKKMFLKITNTFINNHF